MANFRTYLIIPFVLGIAFTCINIYGEFQQIRPADFSNDQLRFPDDQPETFEKTISQLKKIKNETDLQFSQRVTQVVSAGLAHIHWEAYSPDKFNQLVPIWENYFLFFMGMFTNIPEYEKYHFANYKKSLERGIGICGDASMIMSQILDEQGIANKILTFPGHVVVSAEFSDGNEAILDADFGVTVVISKNQLKENYNIIAQQYISAGYTARDEIFFQQMYQQDYIVWDGVEHFITNKYYFEHISYALKWPLPILLIIISILFLKKKNKMKLDDA
jgi:hypothetical protein